MEELFNLTYKDEVELLKDKDDFEAIGDKKYINHHDMEARLYWAFCRPSGSSALQIQDKDPIVSIMAFNHSRLGALERYKLLHKDVIKNENLRKKIKNRSRMLFRALIDDDFKELNEVLDLVPQFLPFAIDQLKNGRLWNDIDANPIEATKFIKKAKGFIDNDFKNRLYIKLTNFEEFEADEIKSFLEEILPLKNNIDNIILNYYKNEILIWIKNSNLHILQLKSIEILANKALQNTK